MVDPFKILHGVLLISTMIVLTVAMANQACFVLLFWERSDHAVYPTCRTLFRAFRMRGIDDDPNGPLSWRALQGLLVNGFAVPFLVLAGSVYLLKRNSQLYLFNNVLWGGDPNMHFWTLVFVLFPCMFVIILPQITTPEDTFRAATDHYGIEKWQWRLSQFAAISGDAAVMALSLFLVPVAKHSPLIHVFGLSFTQALVFHRVAGWISFLFTVLHGGLYLIDYGTYLFDGRGDEHDERGFGNIIRQVIPPSRCWTLDVLRYHYTDWGMMMTNRSSTNLTMHTCQPALPRQLSMQQEEKFQGTHYECNHYFFNFSGFVSMTAFIVLGIFSLPWVRRRFYRLFYTVHIPMAWIMLLGAIVHITYDSLYLVPNIIYYFAPTVSVWVHQFISAWTKKGVQIASVTELADSSGCCLVRLRGAGSAPSTSDGFSLGSVCKICVPRISAIWHPFSTIQDQTNGDHLLLIRPTGPFTKELLNYFTSMPALAQEERRSETTNNNIVEAENGHTLDSTSVPSILVDGFYPAEYRWHVKSLQHDFMLLVAGGVGIVPFLPLLSELYHTMSEDTGSSQDTHLRHVALHWYCREEGLARFVCKEFLSCFLQGATTCNGLQEDDNIEEGQSAVNAESFEDEEMEETRTITFEVFIHVTSRPCNEDDGGDQEFVSSFLSRINHDDNQNNLPCVDKTFKVLDGSGAALEKAHVASTNDWSQNLWRLLWFETLVLICSALSWWYFKLATHIGRSHSDLIRMYSVLLSLVASASFSVALDWLCTKKCREGSYNSIPEDIPSIGSAQTVSTGVRRMRKRICVTSGRPVVNNVVKPVVKATCPGAMFCGPQKLRDSVKSAIRRGQKSESCGSMWTPCAFYDEQSDM